MAASCICPGIPIDGKTVFTSDHALKLEWLPNWIAIIGSGYIGLEFSDVYTALGCEVTFIEVGSQQQQQQQVRRCPGSAVICRQQTTWPDHRGLSGVPAVSIVGVTPVLHTDLALCSSFCFVTFDLFCRSIATGALSHIKPIGRTMLE